MPRMLQQHGARDQPDHRRPVGQRGRLRAALLDPVPQLGEGDLRRSMPSGWSIVSRGGCGAWYRDIGARYVDLFDYFTPEQFRQQSEQRITDRPAEAADDVRVRSRHRSSWCGRRCISATATCCTRCTCTGCSTNSGSAAARSSVVENFTCFAPLPPLDAGDLAGDSSRTTTWPSGSISTTPFRIPTSNRRFVADLVDALAETTDVVAAESVGAARRSSGCADRARAAGFTASRI